MNADIKQNTMNIECVIPYSIQQGKLLIKDCVCMEFYDETQHLALENDMSGIGLGAAILQTQDGARCPRDIEPNNSILRPTVFSSKCLISTERRYCNIERETLGIFHGLEKFLHYCFAREVSITTDYKPPLAMVRNILQHCHKEYGQFFSGYIS